MINKYYKFIYKDDKTGIITEELFSFVDVFSGEARKFIDDNQHLKNIEIKELTGIVNVNGDEVFR